MVSRIRLKETKNIKSKYFVHYSLLVFMFQNTSDSADNEEMKWARNEPKQRLS